MKRIIIFLIPLVMCLTLRAQTDEGLNALNAGMYATAKQWYINQLKDTLTHPEICYYLGEVYRLTGNSDSAMIFYNIGINSSFSNPLCLVGKAGLLMVNNPEKAKALIKEAASARSYKKNPALQVAIANVYCDNNQLDLANEYIKQAKDKNLKYPYLYITEGDILLKQQNPGDAANKYETAIYFDARCNPAYLKIANIFYLAKMYDKSLSYIERLKVVDPTFPAAIKLAGDIYYEQGKYAKAVSNYNEYLKTPEAETSDRIRYAFALFFNKEYEKSIAEIKTLIPLNPDNNYLKRIMAYNLYETGNYTDGLKQMEEFLKAANPSIILASDYKYYARLLSKNNLDSLSAVNYEKAIILSDKAEEYYKELALLYEKMKHYDRAALCFEKYIRTTSNPANSDLFYWGRDCYFTAGTIDSAKIATDPTQAEVRKKWYEKADSIFGEVNNASPNNHLGSLWRARVNSILDPDTELGLAKPYYERVIELLDQPGKNNKKELIEACQYLGYYYYLKNDLTNSKLYWKKILEIDPDHAVAKQAIKGIK